MDERKRACMVETDEEDEDGNLGSADSEASMGESDEEYVDENLSEDSKYSSAGSEEEEGNLSEEEEVGNLSEDCSNSSSTRNKNSLDGEAVYVPEDSSSFEPEDEGKINSFVDNDKKNLQKTRAQVKKSKPTGDKIGKSTKLKTQTKVTKKKSKESENNESCGESSDNSITTLDSGKSKNSSMNCKFTCQPTPLCDAIMKDLSAPKKNNEQPPEKRILRGSKSTNNSKNITSCDINEKDQGELNDQSKDLQNDLNVDPLLVKKEETDIKLEICDDIKEDIEISDQIKEDIDFSEDDLKPLCIKDESSNLVNFDQSQEGNRLMKDNELGQCNIQSKRKRMKRKNEEDDDPSFSPETTKPVTLSSTRNNSTQQENYLNPVVALTRIDLTQSIFTSKRGRGRPSKYLPYRNQCLSERNKELENNLLSDMQVNNERNSSVSAPKSLSRLGKTVSKSVDQTSSELQPATSMISCDLNSVQSTPPRKRGRPAKNKNTRSSPQSQPFVSTAHEVNSVVNLIDAGLVQNSQLTKQEPNETVSQDDLFDKNDLLCLQELDTASISSATVQMTADTTAKETNSFIAEYLNAHQNVFDNSFFQNILPVLSEILMLCMDEFTELLVRNKKAESFTSEELRQQEIKLAVQSFCSTVSTYSEKFFPNFNSVMYKINQNKTKKGLIIALVFFLANSLWIKVPKFKGQIHIMRRMLMCMCQIRKINSPLFLAVLTSTEKIFNNELMILVKILLVLQKNNVLAIPITALPENSSNDSIEETCESIISLSTSCSSVIESYSNHPYNAAQFMETLQNEKQHDRQRIDEDLDHILCMLRRNIHESGSETQEKSSFESGLILSLTQQERDQVLAENLQQNQGDGLDSLFESYLKSTRSTNDDIKPELDVDYGDEVLTPCYKTESSDLRFAVPAVNIDNVMEVEEVDCGGLTELTENATIAGTESGTISPDLETLIPDNCDQDPLSF